MKRKPEPSVGPRGGRALRKQKIRLAARREGFQESQGRRKPGSMNRHKSHSIKTRR